MVIFAKFSNTTVIKFNCVLQLKSTLIKYGERWTMKKTLWTFFLLIMI